MLFKYVILEAKKAFRTLFDNILKVFEASTFKFATQVRWGVSDFDDLTTCWANAAAWAVNSDMFPKLFRHFFQLRRQLFTTKLTDAWREVAPKLWGWRCTTVRGSYCWVNNHNARWVVFISFCSRYKLYLRWHFVFNVHLLQFLRQLL